MTVRVVVIMGVSGCGKSTVGKLLAERLGCEFLEGDSAHPARNIAKMASGVPLTDEDRMPWLLAIHSRLKAHLTAGRRLVISCSALKPAYRRVLLYGSAAAGADSSSAATAAAVTPLGPAAAAATPPVKDAQTRPQNGGDGDSGAPPCGRLRQDDGDGGGDSDGAPPSAAAAAVAFVLLDPSPVELRRRLHERGRAGSHFMPASLLDSQLATLSYVEDELSAHFRGGGSGDGGHSHLRGDGGGGGGDGGSGRSGGGGGDGDGGDGGGCGGDGGVCGGADGGDGGFPDPQTIVEELLKRL